MALVGIPVILLLTMAGGFFFFFFVAIVSTLALREFYLLAAAKGASPQSGTGMVFGILLCADFMFVRWRDLLLTWFQGAGVHPPAPTMAQGFLILFLLFVPIALGIELFRNRGSALLNLGVTFLGVLYVSFFFGTLIGIRELFIPEDFPVYLHFPVAGVDVPAESVATIYRWGGYTVLVILASIWSCDSAAYFGGRAFGKRKLFERVSPKKTWVGAIAGFLFAILAFAVGRELALPYLTPGQAIVCGAIVGIFGQGGDLVESLMKRDAGVKDSSALIPGHGGILDRFDSLMYVSPILFLYLDFVVF